MGFTGNGDRPTAVVTGASRGIGRAIARRLARDHAVVVTARDEKALDTVAGEISAAGGRSTSVVVDLTDAEAVDRAFRNIAVDVLVNNAGVMHKKPFVELEAREWHEMVDVNLNALYYVTLAVLPGMMRRGRGHVIVIGSIAGRSAFVGGTGYAATKHAVLGFTESLMLEVRQHGVKVSVVMPGSVATDLLGREADPGWMLRAEDVAESVAQLVATPPAVLVHRVEIRALKPPKKA